MHALEDAIGGLDVGFHLAFDLARTTFEVAFTLAYITLNVAFEVAFDVTLYLTTLSRSPI